MYICISIYIVGTTSLERSFAHLLLTAFVTVKDASFESGYRLVRKVPMVWWLFSDALIF